MSRDETLPLQNRIGQMHQRPRLILMQMLGYRQILFEAVKISDPARHSRDLHRGFEIAGHYANCAIQNARPVNRKRSRQEQRLKVAHAQKIWQ